jgi:hypothetical protein
MTRIPDRKAKQQSRQHKNPDQSGHRTTKKKDCPQDLTGQ